MSRSDQWVERQRASQRSAVGVGMRFGRLVVTERIGRVSKQMKWRCRCDCGTERDVYQSALRRGETRSCGCLLREYRGQQTRPAKQRRDRNETARLEMRSDIQAAGVPASAFEWARRAWA